MTSNADDEEDYMSDAFLLQWYFFCTYLLVDLDTSSVSWSGKVKTTELDCPKLIDIINYLYIAVMMMIDQ